MNIKPDEIKEKQKNLAENNSLSGIWRRHQKMLALKTQNVPAVLF